MRLLVFSDVHANATALEAALEACAGHWEKAVCLGDVVGYGPDPNEVVRRVRSLVSAAVRGNHDKAVGGAANLEDFNPAARAAIEWTRAQLLPENLEYLRNLPGGPLEAEGVALVHGAVEDEDEYVFTPDRALDGILTSPRTVTFFGHTHIQGGFSFDGDSIQSIDPQAGSTDESKRNSPATGNTLLVESGVNWAAARWRFASCFCHLRSPPPGSGILADALRHFLRAGAHGACRRSGNADFAAGLRTMSNTPKPLLDDEKSRAPMVLLVGIAAALVLIGMIYLAGRLTPAPAKVVEQPLPMGPAEQAYAPEYSVFRTQGRSCGELPQSRGDIRIRNGFEQWPSGGSADRDYARVP